MDEIPMLDWQIVRYGDTPEARAALAYYRAGGWNVDSPYYPEVGQAEDRVWAFKAGWRAALAALPAAHQAGARQALEGVRQLVTGAHISDLLGSLPAAAMRDVLIRYIDAQLAPPPASDYTPAEQACQGCTGPCGRCDEALPVTGWQPIETAPPGLMDGKWTYVLFSGYSKGGSFAGRVVVSGWMGKTHDGRYEPVHNYSYKLVITHWMPLPPPPATPEDAQP